MRPCRTLSARRSRPGCGARRPPRPPGRRGSCNGSTYKDDPLDLRSAAAHSDWSIPALWVFVACYVVFATTAWFVYLRAGSGYVADEKAVALAPATA